MAINSPISIESPCVRNCCLDDDDVCMGCFRTLDEIKDWASSSEQQKLNVLESCLRRKQIKQQRRNISPEQEQ